MVERLEGFCSQNDWQRAYNEINEFERELKDWGAVIRTGRTPRRSDGR